MKFLQLIMTITLVLMQIDGQRAISSCGRLIHSGIIPLITNASPAQHWPWHAAIYHHQYFPLNPMYTCGGTVISQTLVLTAAHCVSEHNGQLDAKYVSVSLGRLNLNANEAAAQSFEVARIIIHPHYNTIDYANDIAIVRLSDEAEFNNYVQPICLWKQDKTDIKNVVGKAGTVVGWGRTENGRVSNVLQQATSPVVDHSTCIRSNPMEFQRLLSDSKFCAGIRNGTSVCNGDSGGSMTFKEHGIYYIRGIVSVSLAVGVDRMCDTTQYAIFTDVARYLTWIKEVTTTFNCEAEGRCGSYLTSDKIHQTSRFSPISFNENQQFESCGQSTHTDHSPWHAAIYLSDLESGPDCGGTLINSRSILTSAHCVIKKDVLIDTKKVLVVLGRSGFWNVRRSGQSFGVAKILIHPQFNPHNYHNNIAIIRLAGEANFNSHVQPVCLWKSKETNVVDSVGATVGWGLRRSEYILQQSYLTVVDRSTCLGSNPKKFQQLLSDSNYCAGNVTGTRVCYGESGGSMTFEENGRYYIRGVVSSIGRNITDAISHEVVCEWREYVIFTDVAKFLRWIQDNS